MSKPQVFCSDLFPSALVVSDLVDGINSLASAIREYQNSLEGRCAREIATLRGGNALLRLGMAFWEAILLEPQFDQTCTPAGWENPEQFDWLDDWNILLEMLRSRFSGLIPPIGSGLIYRWFSSSGTAETGPAPSEPLVWYADPELELSAPPQQLDPREACESVDGCLGVCNLFIPEGEFTWPGLDDVQEWLEFLDLGVSEMGQRCRGFVESLEDAKLVWMTSEPVRAIRMVQRFDGSLDVTEPKGFLADTLEEIADNVRLTLRRITHQRVVDSLGSRVLRIPPDELPHGGDCLPYPEETYHGNPFTRALELEAREGVRLPDGGNPLRLLWRYRQFQEKTDERSNVSFAQYVDRLQEAVMVECDLGRVNGKTYDGPPKQDDRVERSVKDADVTILETLAKRDGWVAYQADIDVPRATASRRLNYLLDNGYVRHPDGAKKGWVITDAGKARLKKLEESLGLTPTKGIPPGW